MKQAELLELWDTVGGFQLNELLIEISETPIPFIDYEPESQRLRRTRKKKAHGQE